MHWVILDKAIEILKKAVKLKPDFAAARSLMAAEYNRQAIAFMAQGNLEAAREALEAGIQAKGGAAVTEALRNNLGCLYVRENRLDQAMGTFKEVIRQNPTFPRRTTTWPSFTTPRETTRRPRGNFLL